MKKILFVVVCFHFFVAAEAQVNRNIQPVSSLISIDNSAPLVSVILPPFDLNAANKMDEEDAAKNRMPKFSRSVLTNITFKNAGSWIDLPNGDRVWRLQITSKGAQALLPYYNKFYLPPGAMLHVYTPDKEEMIGAFTHENNPADGFYATGLIHGETCILEYYEPVNVKGKGEICLNEIGHAYRWVENYFPKKRKAGGSPLSFNQSESCEVNVNCSEGAAYQNEKRAVACIIVMDAFGQGSCSGTMVNNVRQDCTPYLLSAQHCSEDVAPNQFSQWLFYYNFEAPACANPSAIGHIGDYFITGCTKKAESNDVGGEKGSDFLLLQLTQVPPDSFQVYYAGWNNANVTSDSGVAIHHPFTDMKKISTYTQNLVSDTWDTMPNTHWRVRWVATTHGHGVTEEGSSGSALFNKHGQIVGTLTGGNSDCSAVNASDYFGKFSYHWVSNGTTANLQLKPWLDPDNTGAVSLAGRNAGCIFNSIKNKEEEISFYLFPNPSDGLFSFHFYNEEEKQLSITDLTGRLVNVYTTSARDFTIDLSKESKGVYVVQVDAGKEKAIRKLVLQ